MATSEPARVWSMRTASRMPDPGGKHYGLLGLSLLLLLSAQTSLPRLEVWIARGASQQEIARFSVEVADTPETWERGLMERASLAPNAGMLFIFPDVAPRAFWMMNTLIPLDMLFIDADHRIIN